MKFRFVQNYKPTKLDIKIYVKIYENTDTSS